MYQNVFFNDSGDESFGLSRKLFNLFLISNNCSEGDIFQFNFSVFVGDENYIIGVEQNPRAFSFRKLELKFPSSNFNVLV